MNHGIPSRDEFRSVIDLRVVDSELPLLFILMVRPFSHALLLTMCLHTRCDLDCFFAIGISVGSGR